MHIYNSFYCDKHTKLKKNLILRKIKYHAGLNDIYLINNPINNDYMEIIPAYQLKQKGYPLNDLYILGFAKGYDSAQNLMLQIIEDFTLKYETVYYKEMLQKELKQLFTEYKGYK